MRFSQLLQHLAITLLVLAGSAQAQTFPDKPVKVILPFPPGTGPDTVMRIVGEKLAKYWGQPVIIDNRAGGNGWIAMDAVRRSPADGYTLAQVDFSLVSLHPHLYKRLPYDVVADFDPVATMYRTYFFLTVAADSKWNTVDELIAAARSDPGHLTFGSSGNGSPMHLGGSMLELESGVKMSHIPYKDTPQAFVDISKGDIGFAFGTASTTAPILATKRVKYLAIAAPTRAPAFPNVPTMAEAKGPANFELQAWVALYGPHGIPKAVTEKINADVSRALREPDVREKMVAANFEPLVSTPEALRTLMQTDSEKYKGLVGRMNISLD